MRYHTLAMRIDISEISPAFPDFRVAAVVASGLAIPPTRPAELAALISERESACRARWQGTELSEIPGVAVWRAAYRAFGIKKTSYRCSVERLVKNVLADRPLPEINAFVDAYNAVSLTHVMPAGADDFAYIVGDIAFRYARPGDTFLDMAGEGGPVSDPPKDGEVVYADAEKVLCRRLELAAGRALSGEAGDDPRGGNGASQRQRRPRRGRGRPDRSCAPLLRRLGRSRDRGRGLTGDRYRLKSAGF